VEVATNLSNRFYFPLLMSPSLPAGYLHASDRHLSVFLEDPRDFEEAFIGPRIDEFFHLDSVAIWGLGRQLFRTADVVVTAEMPFEAFRPSIDQSPSNMNTQVRGIDASRIITMPRIGKTCENEFQYRATTHGAN
jgi:hypothetical protein